MEFTRERAVSAVGKGTLDHLSAVIAELDRAYPGGQPPNCSYANQGNRAASTELIRDARQVCEQLPDQMPRRFSTDSAEHTSYTIATNAASCFVALGEWKQAEQQARTAIGVGRWSPGRAAYAQLDLGIALTHLGFPDEAAERGKQALALGRGYGSLLQRAHKLDAALRSRYPKEAGTAEYRAKIEEVAG